MENEEKNSSSNQNIIGREEEDNNGLHFKKIQIKPMKKDNNINIHYKQSTNFNIPNKIKNNQNINKNQRQKKNEKNQEDNKFMFEDINNQLDEILENIDNDGIEEINKKIKLLKEDKNMLNTISYSDNINENKWNYKKIDNTNKTTHTRNKIVNDNYNNMNNYINHNQHNKHYYMYDNRNITNNRYMFNTLNNSYRNRQEENNCNDDDCDDYLNKTNISLFYKYNKLYNPKKFDEE